MAVAEPRVLSALACFTCTYSGLIGGLRTTPSELMARFATYLPQADSSLVGFNSNFGHGCRPDWAGVLQPKARRKKRACERIRAVQGDGTSFNSSVEIIVSFGLPGDKLYKIKCFPSNGQTQVPGVIREDLSDGHDVLALFCRHLVAAGYPDAEIQEEHVTMLNYKFALEFRDPTRTRLNLELLAAMLAAPDIRPISPFPLMRVIPPKEICKMSFVFSYAGRDARVVVFQSGKFNVLGASNADAVRQVYEWMNRLLIDAWSELVFMVPLTDEELLKKEAMDSLRQRIYGMILGPLVGSEPGSEPLAVDKGAG